MQDIINKLVNYESSYKPLTKFGNKTKNAEIISFENGQILKCYDTVIAIKLYKDIYLTRYWNYSKTTGYYRNDFLNETKKETLEKIKDKTYKLI